MKRTITEVVVVLLLIILCGVLMGSRNKLIEERDDIQKKLDRWQARYEMGDMEHSIEFEHTCGHRELFSLSREQGHYLMQLQAHSCYDCNRKNESTESTESKEPL
jgi:hypothetical protein